MLLQTPKSFPWHLQHSCKHQKVFQGTCSIAANVKKFFEALAAFLQTPKSFRGICSVPANAKKFFEAFAAFLQTPKSFSRHLRSSRKRQKVFRDTCGVPANAKKFFEALAEFPQTPKSFSRHLRGSRKRQKVFQGTCGVPASLLVWRKPKEGSGKNDRVLGDKCIGSNGFASAKKRQSVGIDEDGA